KNEKHASWVNGLRYMPSDTGHRQIDLSGDLPYPWMRFMLLNGQKTARDRKCPDWGLPGVAAMDIHNTDAKPFFISSGDEVHR
ncbi:MAG: hypothetical protein NTV84_04860, partial [Methanoregula sp.]|nr:hypothetical protein [Methanoregula sp.]